MSLPPKVLSTALIAILAIQVGCTAPSPTQGGFNSPAPTARTHAIKVTVQETRRSGTLPRKDLKSMVELLLAEDDLVRFMAISGLEDLTGETHGYRFFDAPEVRYESILLWREYALTAKTGGRFAIEPPPAKSKVQGEATFGAGEKG